MAVTRTSRSIVMTEAGDTVAMPLKIHQIKFSGTGLTATQTLTLRDKASGSIVAKHVVTAANEDEFLTQECFWVQGLYLEAVPAAGTFQVTVFLR